MAVPARVPLCEDPLRPPARAPRGLERLASPPLLTALRAAQTLDQRRRLIDAQLGSLGFDALGYTRMRWVRGQPQALAACTAHSGGAWAAHYFRQGYEQVDPRLHEISASALPCVWQVDRLEQRAPRHWPRPLLRRFVIDLHASGARSGLMVAVSGPRPHESSCISLRSSSPGTERHSDARVGQALALAYCVHEFYSPWVMAPPPLDPPQTLPPLQTAVLRSLAEGLGDKQIAARLNLGAHGLDYHLRQLRKRFGAHNRVQLLERAAAALADDSPPAGAARQAEASRCSAALTN